MIQIKDPSDCCGCGACVQACPKECIVFSENEEGFEYPVVHIDTCINCGLCEKVCPMRNLQQPAMPIEVRGAVTTEKKVLMESSSGGMFHHLAIQTIKEGGAVFGACFDEHFRLRHQWTDQEERLGAFQGSKYVQSSNHDAYREVKRMLKDARPVLFCGTPCMIAGLHRYLGKDDPNLLTVDFFCHGVPSPGVWQGYLASLYRQYHIQESDVSSISFRDKATGWRRYRMVMTLNNGRRISIKRRKNFFQKSFDENLSLRPSCYDCPFRKGRSHSDLTLADFWDVSYVMPQLDNDTGYSLVFSNTEKGIAHFPLHGINAFSTAFSTAIAHNPAFLSEKTPCHPRRAEFYRHWKHANDTAQLLAEVLRLPFYKQLKRDFDALKYRIKLALIAQIKTIMNK